MAKYSRARHQYLCIQQKPNELDLGKWENNNGRHWSAQPGLSICFSYISPRSFLTPDPTTTYPSIAPHGFGFFTSCVPSIESIESLLNQQLMAFVLPEALLRHSSEAVGCLSQTRWRNLYSKGLINAKDIKQFVLLHWCFSKCRPLATCIRTRDCSSFRFHPRHK